MNEQTNEWTNEKKYALNTHNNIHNFHFFQFSM